MSDQTTATPATLYCARWTPQDPVVSFASSVIPSASVRVRVGNVEAFISRTELAAAAALFQPEPKKP